MKTLQRFLFMSSIVVAISGSAVFAANYVVDSTGDDHDAVLGDSVCDTGGGECTLRAAIEEASALPGGDTIRFRLPAPSVIFLENGELHVPLGGGHLKVKGPGPDALAVDGAGASRVLSTETGSTVFIQNLTLQNGAVIEDDDGSHFGGGIENWGVLSLTNVTVRGNSSDTLAGGIHNLNSLTLSGSRITDNVAEGLDGGGVWNEGFATFVNTLVNGNSAADFAGGILNTGRMDLISTTVSGNDAPVGAGGIDNGGIMTLVRSTVSGNTSADHAAGIDNRVTLTLINSTVSGNINFDEVGGIENFGNLQLWNSTITANISDVAGGLYGDGNLLIANSIIAGNFGPEGEADPQADCAFLPPSIDSRGFNLYGLETGCAPGAQDVTIDPGSVASYLGPLRDNGGPTSTHALLEVAGNPAVEGGNPAGCTDAAGAILTSDQRGRLRPAPPGGRCDIGAYELQPSIPMASFVPVLTLDPHPPAGDESLDLRATFTLGGDRPGIDAARERFILDIGSYTIEIHEGLLRRDRSLSQLYFKGVLDGATVRVKIVSAGAQSYTLRVVVFDADVSAITNPVPVRLSIGDNVGAKTIVAKIE